VHFSEMFYDILIILAASVVVVSLFKRVKTSAILGYLTAGIVIGPTGLAIIADSDGLHTLAEIGVVFLLFMIGLEFSVSRLKSLLRLVVGLGGLQVVLTGTLITLTAIAFAFAPGPAVIIGGGLALSSTAFVLQLLTEQGERDTKHGKIVLAILLMQDLAIVPLLILLTVLVDTEASFFISLGMAAGEAAISLGLIYILGRLLVTRAYRLVAQAEETDLIIVATFLLIFGIGWFLSLFGVSMALGGFLAGLLLAETEFKHQIEADIKPFKGMLLGLFFITVGMTIDLQLLFANFTLILALVLGALFAKTVLTTLLCRAFNIEIGISVRVGLLLAQGGEFGFVLYISAGSVGLLDPETVQILLTCVALSMATTPFLAKAGEKAWQTLTNRKSIHIPGKSGALKRISDHAIIVGLGRVGQTIATLLKDTGLPVVALDLDIEHVQKMGGARNRIYYGDAKQVTVLHSVGIERAKCVVVTIDETQAANNIIHAIRQIAPRVQIFVRARDVAHVRILEKNEIVRAVPEAVEGSLQLGALILRDFGVPEEDQKTIIDAHRNDLYEHLTEDTESKQRKKPRIRLPSSHLRRRTKL
jgi:CPA2 family monovalent cation:H+ antiporter-2